MLNHDEMIDIIRLYGRVNIHEYGAIVFYRPMDDGRFGSTIETVFDMLRTWMLCEVADIEEEASRASR